MNTFHSTHTDPEAMERRAEGMQGFSLLYVIAVLTVVAAMAATMFSFTTGTQFTQLRENYTMQARFMALAGLQYLSSQNTNHRSLEGETFDVRNDNDVTVGTFEFIFVQRLVNLQVRAGILGTSAPGTKNEANYYLEGLAKEDFQGIASSVQDDFEDFTVITSDPNKDPVDKVDGTEDISASQRSRHGSASETEGEKDDGSEDTPDEVEGLVNTFEVGAENFQAFGIATFSGDRVFLDTTCIEGECDFKTGLRFFMTVFYDFNDADGLVITVFNGEKNDFTDVGGDSQHGEMMAYGGDSRVLTGGGSYPIVRFVDDEGNGIQSPKLGLEIDNWGNQHRKPCGGSGTNTDTNGKYWFNSRNPVSGTRYDYGGQGGGSGTDHVTFVAWGLDTPYGCAGYNSGGSTRRQATASGNFTTADGDASYDDNMHSHSSWLWNPLNYSNPAFNQTGEVAMSTTSARSVAQIFTVSEDLRLAQVKIYMRRQGTRNSNELRVQIQTTTTGPNGGLVPSGTVVANGNSRDFNHDDMDNDDLPDAASGTTASVGNQQFVFAPFYFTDLFTGTSGGPVLTDGTSYAIVLTYDTGSNNLRVGTSSNATNPGNYAVQDNGGTWTDSPGLDLVFYALFDPPDTERNTDFGTSARAIYPMTSGSPGYEGETDYSLINQRLAVRMEVHRELSFDGTRGGYPYRMIFWVRRCLETEFAAGCPGYINTFFSDTSGDLDTIKNPPLLERTFYLNEEDHSDFETFLVGIAEATGGATQNATFQDIIIQFRNPADVPIDEVACFNCTDRIEF